METEMETTGAGLTGLGARELGDFPENDPIFITGETYR